MSTPYLGEIRVVGFTFPPVGWATCNGQMLSINEYGALYQLLGLTYGGDGNSQFAVPNLNGAVVVGAGQGATGSTYTLGQTGGATDVTVNTVNLPPHNHSISGSLAGTSQGTSTDTPAGNLPGLLSGAYSSSSTPNANLNAGALTGITSAAGQSQSHTNIQPSLALNYIICTEGLYPPRGQ